MCIPVHSVTLLMLVVSLLVIGTPVYAASGSLQENFLGNGPDIIDFSGREYFTANNEIYGNPGSNQASIGQSVYVGFGGHESNPVFLYHDQGDFVTTLSVVMKAG